MKQYFQDMSLIGSELRENERNQGEENAREIAKVEQEVALAGREDPPAGRKDGVGEAGALGGPRDISALKQSL